MRTVFMGSGAFAVPSLEALVRAGHEVVAVVSQPDREKGRGRTLAAPAVKSAALALQLPVLQPARVREAAIVAELRALAPQVLVVAAYGQILPREIIDLAPLAAVNVHASLLPRYRGAAPIQWAIVRGDLETGVTTMLMDEGLDTGPALLTARTHIGPDETAGQLEGRLAVMGAELLVATLPLLAAGQITPVPQDEALASHARRLRKEDGHIDWRWQAAEVARRVRAFNPWPCAHTFLAARLIRILRARVGEPAAAPPGEILLTGRNGLAVACGDGLTLEVVELQPENRKAMETSVFLAGARLSPGQRFE
jgi:methionyl-tRNA formyltransferase